MKKTLMCSWKTGVRQRFLVTGKPTDATHTIYSGFTGFGEKFTRPATGQPPKNINLPRLPE